MSSESSSPLYPVVPARRPPLRIGVMLDRLTAPAWIADVLSDVKSSAFAELAVAIVNEAAEVSTPRKGRIARLLQGEARLGQFLYYRYAALDQKKHPQFFAPFVEQDVSGFFRADQVLAVRAQRKKYVNHVTADDVAKIEALDLDVILRFGFNILRGDILTCARFGVWSYHHGDNDEYRGGPAHFWEVHERNPVSGAILQILTEELDGGKVIYRSYGATMNTLWPSQNKASTYRKASSFVIRCLRRLYLENSIPIEPPRPKYARRLYREPTNTEMVPLLARIAIAGVANRVRDKLRRDQWFIAYRKSDRSGSAIPGADGFTPIMPPGDRFFADPCVIAQDGAHFIFFEDYDFGRGKGKISFVRVDAEGQVSPPAPALELDVHLSYPFVFRWNGEIFMVPEMMQRNAVQLFRALEFPTRWQLVGDLLTGVAAVDATLFEHEGLWFMFANVSERGGSTWDELFLFVADRPTGPWRPHPRNPVKSDARSARPAGNIFRRNGKLIRPSQDCTGTYGRAIVFSEILELSPDNYAEQVLGRIEPTWAAGIIGTHTFSTDGTLDVIDAKRSVPIWRG